MTQRPIIFLGMRGDLSMHIYLTQQQNIPVLGIIDKYYYGNTESSQGIPIIGSEEQLLDPNDPMGRYWKENCDFVVTSFWNGSQNLQNIGLNNEQVRIDRCNLLDQLGVNVRNLIDDSLFYVPGHNITYGKGIVIAKYVGMKANITIGDYCEIDTFSCFGHGVVLGRNVTVGTYSLLSDAIIEDNVRLGIKTIVAGALDNNGIPLTVGTNSTVWNGVTVFKNVPPNSMVVPPMPRILSKQRKIPVDN